MIYDFDHMKKNIKKEMDKLTVAQKLQDNISMLVERFIKNEDTEIIFRRKMKKELVAILTKELRVECKVSENDDSLIVVSVELPYFPVEMCIKI